MLENRGRANSPADVTVYLPEARVLFTGDILVHPLPYVGASHPLPWIDVLRAVEATPISAMVPGHGPVFTDHSYTRSVRQLFEVTRDRVAALMKEGKLLDAIVKSVDLSDQARLFSTPDAAENLRGAFKDVLVERMHQCVQGYRC